MTQRAWKGSARLHVSGDVNKWVFCNQQLCHVPQRAMLSAHTSCLVQHCIACHRETCKGVAFSQQPLFALQHLQVAAMVKCFLTNVTKQHAISQHATKALRLGTCFSRFIILDLLQVMLFSIMLTQPEGQYLVLVLWCPLKMLPMAWVSPVLWISALGFHLHLILMLLAVALAYLEQPWALAAVSHPVYRPLRCININLQHNPFDRAYCNGHKAGCLTGCRVN